MTVENPFEAISLQLEAIGKKVNEIDNKLSEQTAPADSEHEYLTTNQVCQLLKVSRVTLWSWNKKGVLVPVRIGNLLRYRKEDIEQFIK